MQLSKQQLPLSIEAFASKLQADVFVQPAQVVYSHVPFSSVAVAS
jgi:hypothetical protein